MRKWETEIFRGNNVRLMKCHIWLLVPYLLLAAVAVIVAGARMNLLWVLMWGIPIVLHSFLAYGSYKKIELSRKVSVVVFVLLAIGLMPIGTLFAAFIFLPATQWKIPLDG